MPDGPFGRIELPAMSGCSASVGLLAMVGPSWMICVPAKVGIAATPGLGHSPPLLEMDLPEQGVQFDVLGVEHGVAARLSVERDVSEVGVDRFLVPLPQPAQEAIAPPHFVQAKMQFSGCVGADGLDRNERSVIRVPSRGMRDGDVVFRGRDAEPHGLFVAQTGKVFLCDDALLAQLFGLSGPRAVRVVNVKLHPPSPHPLSGRPSTSRIAPTKQRIPSTRPQMAVTAPKVQAVTMIIQIPMPVNPR